MALVITHKKTLTPAFKPSQLEVQSAVTTHSEKEIYELKRSCRACPCLAPQQTSTSEETQIIKASGEVTVFCLINLKQNQGGQS